MLSILGFVCSFLVSHAFGQQVGTQQTETHPRMSWKTCTGTGGGSCQTKQGSVVLDSNWRWVHDKNGYTNCYTGNTWNSTICKSSSQCVQNCALDGADYSATYGITTSGDSLKIKFVTEGEYATNVGSRVYLLQDDNNYQMFNLVNQEFTFDVDLSQLPCGLNGALYFVTMDKDGGKSKYTNNKAGAKYGTGYCDAQCPRDLKFIAGQANVEGWKPSKSDQNSGVGNIGSCCPEMDVWEANSVSSAFTPHSCDTTTPSTCSGESCGGTYSETRYAGTCDPDGCDFNTFRQGVPDFYGKGKTVDTSKKFTVVTQFVASGGTLSEIKRFWVVNGKTYATPESTIPGVPGNSVTKNFCDAQKEAFGDRYTYEEHGGFRSMSDGMKNGMVLVMSLWDDHYAHMLWLDSNYPLDKDPSEPGVARGECSTDSGDPKQVEADSADATVTFSNIRFGPIGSTFKQ